MQQIKDLETVINYIVLIHDTDECTVIIGGDFNADIIREYCIIATGVPNGGMSERVFGYFRWESLAPTAKGVYYTKCILFGMNKPWFSVVATHLRLNPNRYIQEN